MSTHRTHEDAGDPRRRPGHPIIEEKLRILRLLRALDRAGVDPEQDPAIRVPLVRLSEIDAFLTSILEFVEREEMDADSNSEPWEKIHAILPIAEGLRGDVLDAVPPRQQDAVRRASSEVAASEGEILLELDAFRRDAKKAREDVKDGRPLSDAEAAAIAEEAWTGDSPLIRLQRDRRVMAHEEKALPDPDDPLQTWFDRLPRPWREAMARYHDIPKKGDGALAKRLADRVSDPGWMRHFLEEKFGASEREMLARFLACPVATVDPDEPTLEEILYVSWDWARQFPASVGGKLRAAGLIHVGSEAGKKMAIVPPSLLFMLGELLGEVDPTSASLPERALRQAQAKRLEDAPFEDAQLDRWKRVDHGLTERIRQWALDTGEGLKGPIQAVFQGGERTVQSEEEAGALFDYALFDWRAAPDRPTLADEAIAKDTFDSDEERALAVATAEALPTLYRIESADRNLDVTLLPVFPAGEAVVVTDRGMSLTVEPGWVIALRVYPAGPYHFARVFGQPLDADRGKVVLRALRRKFRAFVKDGGVDDAETFLRERPWTFLRVLREHWK